MDDAAVTVWAGGQQTSWPATTTPAASSPRFCWPLPPPLPPPHCRTRSEPLDISPPAAILLLRRIMPLQTSARHLYRLFTCAARTPPALRCSACLRGACLPTMPLHACCACQCVGSSRWQDLCASLHHKLWTHTHLPSNIHSCFVLCLWEVCRQFSPLPCLTHNSVTSPAISLPHCLVPHATSLCLICLLCLCLPHSLTA